MKEHIHECPQCSKPYNCEEHDCGGRLYHFFNLCPLCFYKRAIAALADPRKAVANMVILALFLFPFAQLRAQERHRIRVPETASRAVFEQTANAMNRLHTKQLLGQDTALDVAVAASSLQTMFAHEDEVGLTDQIEKYLLSNPGRITDFPNEPELQETFAKVPPDQRQAMADYIRTYGLRNFRGQIVGMLNRTATRMALEQGVRDGHMLAAQYPTQGQRQQRQNQGQDALCTVSFYSGWASLYFGIVSFVIGGPVGTAAFYVGLAVSYYASVVADC